MFENTQETFKVNSAVIKVVGVGGGGVEGKDRQWLLVNRYKL